MEDWAPCLRGSAFWIYLGRNNSLASLLRGDSNTEIIAVLVARFWQMAQSYDICPMFPPGSARRLTQLTFQPVGDACLTLPADRFHSGILSAYPPAAAPNYPSYSPKLGHILHLFFAIVDVNDITP